MDNQVLDRCTSTFISSIVRLQVCPALPAWRTTAAPRNPPTSTSPFSASRFWWPSPYPQTCIFSIFSIVHDYVLFPILLYIGEFKFDYLILNFDKVIFVETKKSLFLNCIF